MLDASDTLECSACMTLTVRAGAVTAGGGVASIEVNSQQSPSSQQGHICSLFTDGNLVRTVQFWKVLVLYFEVILVSQSQLHSMISKSSSSAGCVNQDY